MALSLPASTGAVATGFDGFLFICETFSPNTRARVGLWWFKPPTGIFERVLGGFSMARFLALESLLV